MLKILQARLQQYVNLELPDVQAGFRKAREISDQIGNIHWIIEKARELQKNICFIDYAKAFHCVDHKKLWKILHKMGIPHYLTCLLRNMCACQEETVLVMGREYVKAVYWHPAYLTCMQSTPCKMLG